MKKTVISISLLVLLFTSVLITSSFFVSAQIRGIPNKLLSRSSTSTNNFLDILIENLSPIFAFTIGNVEGGDYLFIKFLVFTIMLSIIYMAIGRSKLFGLNPIVTWIISVAMAILATRFLSTSALVELVWLPTSIVGVTLVCLVPLIVFFFHIEHFTSSVLRKTCWVALAVFFVVFTNLRWNKLNEVGVGNLGWIYIFTAIACLALFLADGTIHSAWQKSAIKNKLDRLKPLDALQIQRDIEEWRKVIADKASTAEQRTIAREEIIEAEKRIKELLST